MERIASLFLLCLAGNMYAGGIKVDKRPNILLFLVDDMGWQDTSVPFGIRRHLLMNVTRHPTWNVLPGKV